MKKFLTLIISLLLVLSLSACKSNDLQQNNSSLNSQQNDISSNVYGENVKTLIRALTGSDDVSNIKSLSIIPNDNSKEIKITDSNDWKFIEKYVYSCSISFQENKNLTDSQKVNLIKVGNTEQELYLLKDGSIIKQEMCGDSGVKLEDRNFEIYKAEEQYMLNEQRLIDMLKKYDNN